MKIDFEFLDRYAFFIDLNANDTFGWACAESETIDITELPGLIELERLFGPSGITAFMSVKRDQDPLSQLIDNNFKEAKKYIKENFISDQYRELIIPKKYLYEKAYENKKFVILDRKKLDIQND